MVELVKGEEDRFFFSLFFFANSIHATGLYIFLFSTSIPIQFSIKVFDQVKNRENFIVNLSVCIFFKTMKWKGSKKKKERKMKYFDRNFCFFRLFPCHYWWEWNGKWNINRRWKTAKMEKKKLWEIDFEPPYNI